MFSNGFVSLDICWLLSSLITKECIVFLTLDILDALLHIADRLGLIDVKKLFNSSGSTGVEAVLSASFVLELRVYDTRARETSGGSTRQAVQLIRCLTFDLISDANNLFNFLLFLSFSKVKVKVRFFRVFFKNIQKQS